MRLILWDGFRWWDRQRDLLVIVGVPIVIAVLASWAYVSGRPLREEHAKLDQPVGPIERRNQELGHVVAELVNAVEQPMPFAVCEDLAHVPVTIIAANQVPLREALAALALQSGAVFRPYSGHHGEQAFPHLLCANAVGGRHVTQAVAN